MIRPSHRSLLLLTAFVMSIGVLLSCNKKDNDTGTSQTTLLSFGPTGARHGDTLVFIGMNLGKVTAIKFTGDSAGATILAKDFKMQSSDKIAVIVPTAAEKGYVTLKTPEGNLVTKTILNLNVKSAARITTVTKQARHGDNVTITGNYLNWVKSVTFAKGVMVENFVSQSQTQLVVKVPSNAENGQLMLAFKGTDTIDLVSADTLKLIMPQITGMAPNPVDTSANLTITGTDLDLVSSVSFVNASAPVTNFVSQSATQLVVKVPSTTLRGKLTFGVKNSTLTVQSPMDLTLNTLPPLPDFTTAIYTDAPQNGFQDWSYTDAHDFNNTQSIRQGSKSIKAVYGGNGYQGLTFHHTGAGISTTGYTKLEFSVFADAAANGKKLQIITNGAYGGPAPQVTLVGGQWTTFSVMLADMGAPAAITEIVIQGAGFTGTIFIDHVGLR